MNGRSGGTDAETPLLEARDLHVEFNARGRRARAVDGVNLAVGRREIVALVGESGCGQDDPGAHPARAGAPHLR